MSTVDFSSEKTVSSVTDMCVSFVTDIMKLNGTQIEPEAHTDSSFSKHFHSAAGRYHSGCSDTNTDTRDRSHSHRRPLFSCVNTADDVHVQTQLSAHR